MALEASESTFYAKDFLGTSHIQGNIVLRTHESCLLLQFKSHHDSKAVFVFELIHLQV